MVVRTARKDESGGGRYFGIDVLDSILFEWDVWHVHENGFGRLP